MTYIPNKNNPDKHKRPAKRKAPLAPIEGLPPVFLFSGQTNSLKMKNYYSEYKEELGGYFVYPKNKEDAELLNKCIQPISRRRLNDLYEMPNPFRREYVISDTSENN